MKVKIKYNDPRQPEADKDFDNAQQAARSSIYYGFYQVTKILETMDRSVDETGTISVSLINTYGEDVGTMEVKV